MRYLDASVFTRLFKHRRRNHAQICLGLHQIARGVARQFTFRSINDRNDIVSAALVRAIERIDRFDFALGGNAFVYFTSLLRNAIIRQLGLLARLRAREQLFADGTVRGKRPIARYVDVA